MELDTRIANMVDKFRDKPWGLACPEEEKWDCLNMLVTFYSELGVELPLEFEGHKYEDYKKIWEKDFKEALDILARWYKILPGKIDPGFIQRGDLILFDASDDKIVKTGWAIYLGNGNILMIFGKYGVKIIPFRVIRSQLSEVRRLIK